MPRGYVRPTTTGDTGRPSRFSVLYFLHVAGSEAQKVVRKVEINAVTLTNRTLAWSQHSVNSVGGKVNTYSN